jgi:hypothetical protein
MKQHIDLYKKLDYLNKEVKNRLAEKGLIVPILQQDGRIKIGYFYIKKLMPGCYTILDRNNNAIVDNINLPQTAVVVANKLALGKWLDKDILLTDKKYGFANFEELLHKKHILINLKKKNYDKADVIQMKAEIASFKKMSHKTAIMSDFEKLISVR